MKLKTYLHSEPTLEQAQDFVDGFVQIIDLKNGDCMILNEDGKIKELSQNLQAQKIWDESFGEGTDYIVGHVIIIKKSARREWWDVSR